MRRAILVAVLVALPVLGRAQVLKPAIPSYLNLGGATLSFNGTLLAASVGLQAPSFTATAASGSVAYRQLTGAKLCLETSDLGCLTANGAVISTGYLAVTELYASSRVTTAGPTTLEVRGNAASGGTAVRIRSEVAYSAGSLVEVQNNTTPVARIGPAGTYSMDGTDASGTPGAATINQPIGQVAVDDTAASVVVTNSLVTTASVVLASLQFVDATCTQILSVVPAAGSFTITMNAACTAHTKIGFVVHNYF